MDKVLYQYAAVFLCLFIVSGSSANAPVDKSIIIPENALRYGDSIWIQNGGHYRKYLVGMQGDLHDNPMTLDPFDEESLTDYQQSCVKWEFLKPTIDGGGGGDDDCVKFGDVVLIKMTKPNALRPYLYLSDTDEAQYDIRNGGAWDGDHVAQNKFIIRSNAGDGNPNITNDDPLEGMCIADMSVVYIQSFGANYRWLKGAYDNSCTSVNLRDFYDGDEIDDAAKFTWILHKHDKGHGHTNEGIKCFPTYARGVWKPIASTPIDGMVGDEYTITYIEGITRSNEHEGRTSDAWDKNVAAFVSANFVFGYSDSRSHEDITTQSMIGNSQGSIVSNLLERGDIDIVHSTTWYYEDGNAVGGAGSIIWQYVIHIEDLCTIADGGWDVTTNEVYRPSSTEEPPCCLPGYFVNDEIPHDPCKLHSPCQCTKEICEQQEQEQEEH